MVCLLWMSQTRTVSSCDPDRRSVPSIDTETQPTRFLGGGGDTHGSHSVKKGPHTTARHTETTGGSGDAEHGARHVLPRLKSVLHHMTSLNPSLHTGL